MSRRWRSCVCCQDSASLELLYAREGRGSVLPRIYKSRRFGVADLKFHHYTVWYLGPVHRFGDSIPGSVANREWVPDQK